jgi:hypothetical protein
LEEALDSRRTGEPAFTDTNAFDADDADGLIGRQSGT